LWAPFAAAARPGRTGWSGAGTLRYCCGIIIRDTTMGRVY
jgi:hypothetical protein